LLLGLIITGGIFCLCLAKVYSESSYINYLGSLLFGYCSCIFFLNIILGFPYIKITDEGFEIKFLFRKKFYLWKDIENFSTGASLGLQKMIIIEFTAEYYNSMANKKGIFNNTAFRLVDTYKMKPTELTDFLNQQKNKLIKQNIYA